MNKARHCWPKCTEIFIANKFAGQQANEMDDVRGGLRKYAASG